MNYDTPLVYNSLGYASGDAFKKNFGYTGTGAWSGFNDQNSLKSYNDAYNNIILPRTSFLNDQASNNSAAFNEWKSNPTAFQGNTPFMTAQQKALMASAQAAKANTSVVSKNPNALTTQSTVNNTSINSAVPKVTSKDLPSFLPSNNNAQIGELSNLLKTLPGYFDTKGIEQAYNQQIDFGNSQGQQVANNAAREFVNRNANTGGNSSVAGLVRAQAMLPVLQQNADLATTREKAKTDASTALAQLTGDISGQIGKLRTDYLGTLANYTSNLQQLSTNASLEQNKLAEQKSEFGQSFGLDQDKLALQKHMAEIESGQNQQQINQGQLKLLASLGLLHNNNIGGFSNALTANRQSGNGVVYKSGPYNMDLWQGLGA